jgi:hypothetical protein
MKKYIYNLLQAFEDNATDNSKAILENIITNIGEEKFAESISKWFDQLDKVAPATEDIEDEFFDTAVSLLHPFLPFLTDSELIEFTQEFTNFVPQFYNNSVEKKMEDFGGFLDMMYGFNNRYATRKEAIEEVFNIRNHTGQRIGWDDIFEANADISAKIMYEACNRETGEQYTLPMAWDDSRDIFMTDINNACDKRQDDVEYQRANYSPVVIDGVENKVYLSLQGDLKKMTDPMTYDGWRSDHLKMKEENEFHDQITETKWYRDYSKDVNCSPGITEMDLLIRMSEKLNISGTEKERRAHLESIMSSVQVPVKEDLTDEELADVLDKTYKGEMKRVFGYVKSGIVIEVIDKYHSDNYETPSNEAKWLGLDERNYLILYRDTYREMCVQHKKNLKNK